MRRLICLLLLVALATAILGEAAAARPAWKRSIDRLVRRHSVGVYVRDGSEALYGHGDRARRIPASNEKLLLSMALFDRLAPSTRIPTIAAARRVVAGVVRGNLYVLGRGDPTITAGGVFGKSLPFSPTRLARLARRIQRAGVTRVRGGVVGSPGYFAHDWWAPGWSPSFPALEVPLASALTFEGNSKGSRHINNPEFRVAKALTHRLEGLGVNVRKGPRVFVPDPANTTVTLATVESRGLGTLVRYMNRKSSNFFAETLGKRLGVERFGPWGTIAKGARAIEAFAGAHGVSLTAFDSSGLSYANRVSPRGIVKLLGWAETQPWGATLRYGLPTGGEGTLEDRLQGVPVRAKTGTLSGISALSGWVRLSRTQSWAEFAILSSGMPKYQAAGIEDAIVRILRRSAR